MRTASCPATSRGRQDVGMGGSAVPGASCWAGYFHGAACRHGATGQSTKYPGRGGAFIAPQPGPPFLDSEPSVRRVLGGLGQSIQVPQFSSKGSLKPLSAFQLCWTSCELPVASDSHECCPPQALPVVLELLRCLLLRPWSQIIPPWQNQGCPACSSWWCKKSTSPSVPSSP